MVLRTTTNNENTLELEVCWCADKWTKAALFWRFKPEYEYDLDVDGHNELLPCRKTESTLRNFDHLLTSSAWRRKEFGNASGI
jgi:hypothetical protein